MTNISPKAERLLDDMSRSLEGRDVDTHRVPKVPEPHLETIEFEHWESLAYDLALGIASDKDLAAGYGISELQLSHLKANPNFAKMLDAKQKEVENLGDNADFTVKMRMIANRATPKLLQRLMNPATEDKDFIKLYETTTRLAKLEPPKETASDNEAAPGSGISINLYGMPGLEHLSQEPTKVVSETKEPIEDADVVSEDLKWL